MEMAADSRISKADHAPTPGTSSGGSTGSTNLSAIISLNVGGHRFQTTLMTLQREPRSMLGRMFSEEWHLSKETSQSLSLEDPNSGSKLRVMTNETFIDRDGRHFHVILNFLRDGPAVALPESSESLRELLREAEYFQLEGLVELTKLKLHMPSRPLKEGEVVVWRRDSIESYWRPFAMSLIQEGVDLGFYFDRVGRKYNDKQTIATCIGCLSRFVLDQITVFDYKLRFEEWESLKHHMTEMSGVVMGLVGDTCCIVAWGNGKRLHVPVSALIPAEWHC